MQQPFKDKVERADARVYKLLRDVPKNHNEGLHRVSFSYVDSSPKKATIRDKASTNPKSRFYHVSPCVLNETECTYKTREKARHTHIQGYNSVLQVEESYLKTRNRNE